MKDYLLDCIDDIPEAINIAAKTPATKSLMRISEASPPLDNKKKD